MELEEKWKNILFLLFALLFNSTVFAEDIMIKTEEELDTMIQSKKAQTVVMIGRLEQEKSKPFGEVYTVNIGTKSILVIPDVKFVKEEIDISKFLGKLVELKGYFEDISFKYEQFVGFAITSIEYIKEKITLIGRINCPKYPSKIPAWFITKKDKILIDYDVFKEKKISEYNGKTVKIKGIVDYSQLPADVLGVECVLISVESIEEIQEMAE